MKDVLIRRRRLMTIELNRLKIFFPEEINHHTVIFSLMLMHYGQKNKQMNYSIVIKALRAKLITPIFYNRTKINNPILREEN